jgi:TrmH family RNA methyltransferase
LARSARERADRRAFVVEGPVLIDEALAAGVTVRLVLAADDADPGALARWRGAGVEVREVPRSAIESVATTVTPQPAVAVCAIAPLSWDPVVCTGPLLLLDAVSDPGNVGTILRSAEAAGAGGVVLGEGCVDLHSPKVVRASAGALFRLAVGESADLGGLVGALKARGRPVYATAADGAALYTDVDLDAAAIIFGSEAHGVVPRLLALADTTVAIPQEGGTESLNVAMAATVVCFEALRQRRNRLDRVATSRQGGR